MDLSFQIRTALKTGKVYLGYREGERALKGGRGRLVILADRAKGEVKEEVEYLAKISGVPVYVFQGTSLELGRVCGKPFPVSVIVVEDPGESRILEIAKGEGSEA